MSKPLVNRRRFAKIVTVLAISFGIGLGLCRLSILPSQDNLDINWLSWLSLLIMVVSFVGLIVTLISWVIRIVIDGLRKGL
jgi:hypothetical protein